MQKSTIKRIREWLKTDLNILSVCLIYYSFLFFLGDTCLIRKIFKLDCPTCGTTRALFCLIKGDFKGYVSFNYLALPLVLSLYGCLHFKGKLGKVFNIAVVIVAVCLIIKYFYK